MKRNSNAVFPHTSFKTITLSPDQQNHADRTKHIEESMGFYETSHPDENELIGELLFNCNHMS